VTEGNATPPPIAASKVACIAVALCGPATSFNITAATGSLSSGWMQQMIL
jgi:hypothetical protein